MSLLYVPKGPRQWQVQRQGQVLAMVSEAGLGLVLTVECASLDYADVESIAHFMMTRDEDAVSQARR